MFLKIILVLPPPSNLFRNQRLALNGATEKIFDKEMYIAVCMSIIKEIEYQN